MASKEAPAFRHGEGSHEVKVKAPNVVLFEAVGGAPVAVEKDATRKALPMGELYLVTITDVPEAKRYRVVYYEYRHPKMGEHHYAHLSSVPRVLRHTDSGRLTRETHVTAEHSADEMRVYFPDWFIAYFDEKHPHKLKPEEKV